VSVQRRRGQVVRIFYSVETTDDRGNATRQATDGPHEMRAALVHPKTVDGTPRGLTMLAAPDVADRLDLWARVEVDGAAFDVVGIAVRSHGPRRARHVEVQLTERARR
jgi:hypothetical protein